ncbi:hypothetical protein V495_01033, partial [Pseudogymnoascus sp. VKM F-4514 (FW-929)]
HRRPTPATDPALPDAGAADESATAEYAYPAGASAATATAAAAAAVRTTPAARRGYGSEQFASAEACVWGGFRAPVPEGRVAYPHGGASCIQAVDLFGLEVEGIYRVSGTAAHVNKIKAIFNNDSSKVDFRNPEAFFHDVNSVAGLLKQFFRELPDPLLTHEQYAPFIAAARLEDDISYGGGGRE